MAFGKQGALGTGFGSMGIPSGPQKPPAGQSFVTVKDNNGAEQFITVTDQNGVEQRLTVVG